MNLENKSLPENLKKKSKTAGKVIWKTLKKLDRNTLFILTKKTSQLRGFLLYNWKNYLKKKEKPAFTPKVLVTFLTSFSLLEVFT